MKWWWRQYGPAQVNDDSKELVGWCDDVGKVEVDYDI